MKFLFPLFLLCSISMPAQSSFSFGPVAGGNASSINLHAADGLPRGAEDFRSLPGWQAGLYTAYQFSERSSFSIQPVFVRRRTQYGVDIGTNLMRIDYLEVPLLYRYHLGRKFFAEAGAYIGFRLNSRWTINGEEVNTLVAGTANDWHADQDFGGLLGVGYQLTKRLELNLRFAQGFVDLYPALQYTDENGQPLSDRPAYLNRSFSLQLAYNLLQP